jgi:hypothetical protein
MDAAARSRERLTPLLRPAVHIPPGHVDTWKVSLPSDGRRYREKYQWTSTNGLSG